MLGHSIGFSVGLAMVANAFLSWNLHALDRAQIVWASALVVRIMCAGLENYLTAKAVQVYLIFASVIGLFLWCRPFALGLLVLAGPVFLGGTALVGPLKKASRRYYETLANLSDSATNLFVDVALVKSLGVESMIGAQFDSIVGEHERQVGIKAGIRSSSGAQWYPCPFFV